MNKQRTYYRPTTAAQRRLLFATWEETGDIEEACRKAHVSQRTFYNWKSRFATGGYAALEQTGSHAPKAPHRTAAAIEAQVIELRRQHASWGKRRIADELTKGHNWVPLVTPNTVRRILQDAGLWCGAEAGGQKGGLQPSPARRRLPDRP